MHGTPPRPVASPCLQSPRPPNPHSSRASSPDTLINVRITVRRQQLSFCLSLCLWFVSLLNVLKLPSVVVYSGKNVKRPSMFVPLLTYTGIVKAKNRAMSPSSPPAETIGKGQNIITCSINHFPFFISFESFFSSFFCYYYLFIFACIETLPFVLKKKLALGVAEQFLFDFF